MADLHTFSMQAEEVSSIISPPGRRGPGVLLARLESRNAIVDPPSAAPVFLAHKVNRLQQKQKANSRASEALLNDAAFLRPQQDISHGNSSLQQPHAFGFHQ